MTSDEKKINISGTNNRYLVNKLIKSKSEIEIRKRKVIEKWGIHSDYFTDEKQLLLLEELYNSIYSIDSIDSKDSNKLCTTNFDLIKQELNKKISSYKQQDIVKKILDNEEFIDFNCVINKMIECELKCRYCICEMSVLYDITREMKQWSVDRIDNDKGHNKDNFHLACLECNLKRRRRTDEKFLFTKQLKLIKQDI